MPHPLSPTGLYRLFRDNLGSLRKIYFRSNDRITRHGDLGQKQQTVLLLHGFMQTRNVWEVMEDRLRYDGYGVFSFDLGGLFYRYNNSTVSQLTALVADKIEGICQRTGLEHFHIVGHSQGGLVARQYVQSFGGERRVRSVITLGTPHHGTPTAAIGLWLMMGGVLSRAPFEMLPQSRLVRRLQTDVFPSHIPMCSIFSTHDLVCPYWCSLLKPQPGQTNLKNIRVRHVGHTALCYDPGIYQMVRAELESSRILWEARAAAG